MAAVSEGQLVTVDGDHVVVAGHKVASGTRQTMVTLEELVAEARQRMGDELERFAQNTLEYLRKEGRLLTDVPEVPDVGLDFKGRHVLIVVRGVDYKDDLALLRRTGYLRELKPVLIGVDGGADALLDIGAKPDVIIGDFDSVSERALRCGATLVVHAYAGGNAPGADRLDRLGLDYIRFESPGTSEDIAMLLAFERRRGADRRGRHAQLDGRLPRQGPGRHGLDVPGAHEGRADPRGRKRREPPLPTAGEAGRPPPHGGGRDGRARRDHRRERTDSTVDPRPVGVPHVINLRFHIVSITAVFLALAIGIAVGTTFIDKATISTLRDRLDGLEERVRATEADNAALQDDLADAERTLDQLGEQGSAQFLAGHLEGVPVMVLATRGVDEDSLAGARQAILDAGATFGGTLWLTERLVLDDDNEIEDLATVLGQVGGDPERLHRALSVRLAGVLMTAARTEPEGAEDTTTTSTDVPSVVEEPELVRDLRGAGFLDFDPPAGAPDDSVALADGVRYVVVSGPGVDVPDELMMLPLLGDMTSAGPAPVVAAQAGVAIDGSTADETRTVFVGPIRDDDALNERVSTVDDLESFAGWAGVVLALQDIASGQLGHYGVGDGADRLLPAPLGEGG